MKNERRQLVEDVLSEIRSGRASNEELVELAKAMCKGILLQEFEFSKANNLTAELNLFRFFTHTGKAPDEYPKDFKDDPLHRFFLKSWVKYSRSSYADAYRLGLEHAAAEIKSNNVKRAANGRRLIGATSRAKVANAAEEFRHLSKEKAAAEIAAIVELDSGTVRRYLSKLFPGDAW